MFVSKKLLRQTLACLTVLFNQFLIGMVNGWVPITMKKLQDGEHDVLRVSDEDVAWIVSAYEIGKISGPFMAPFIIDTVGRRGSMMTVSYFLFLMWPGLLFARNVHLVCSIRLLIGCVHSVFDVLSSIYLTENCSPAVRVVMGSIVSIMYTAGISFETIITTCFSYKGTAIWNAAIAGCAFATFLYCKETPYFLIMKGQYGEAEKNLIWLRGAIDRKSFAEKISEIKATVEEEKRKAKSWSVLFSSTSNIRSICIVLCVHAMSMMTGSSVIGPYSSMIFPPSEKFSTNQYVIMYGTCIFVTSCLSPFVVAAANRRTVLIFSFSIIAASHFFTALLFYLHNSGYDVVYYPWLVFASIDLYGIMRIIFAPALYIIRAELLPLSVRAIGGSMAVMTSAITGFFMAVTFLPITTRFGLEANFFVYSIISVLLAVLVNRLLPEMSDDEVCDERQNNQASGLEAGVVEKNAKEFADEYAKETPNREQIHVIYR